VPYAGRVVVQTPTLREQVAGFESVWTRRLIILGATAKITYDDDRAVFDIYSREPVSLDHVAQQLVDPGGWQLDRYAADGALITWLPPSIGCECSARVRVSYDAHVLCAMTQERVYDVTRPGARTTLPGQLRWRARLPDGRSVITQPPADRGKCPDDGVWPDSVMFQLPLGMSREESIGVVLALAGGSLPDSPRVVSLSPVRGTP